MDTQESETAMARLYLVILQRWLWLIVLAMLLGASIAYLLSRSSQPVYEAVTTLLVSEGQKIGGTDYDVLLMDERLARTYGELLKGSLLLKQVSAQVSPSVNSDDLRKMIIVDTVRDTQLITLRVRHTDPKLAARIANAIPQVFMKQNAEQQAARLDSSKQIIKQQMQSSQAEIVSTQQSIDAERVKATPDPNTLAHLETLLAQSRAAYQELQQQYQSIQLAQTEASQTLTVSEPAQVPQQPILPRTPLNIVVGALLGLMGGIAVASLITYVDNTIRNADDVERATRQAVLGSILRIKGKGDAQKPILATLPNSAAAESYRVLSTNLEFAVLGAGGLPALLLVTSTQPMEGKTTTLANLGVSLAKAGQRVLLVDGDLRHPALHKQFDLPNNVGLTSLLLHPTMDLQESIQDTGIERLRVLTAGPVPANPGEVVRLAQTRALLSQCKALADYVLVDSPPVLAAADASLLAQHANTVLLVTEVGRTRADALRHAVGALTQVGAHIAGVVLNKVVAQQNSRYYGGYDYGYYAPERTATKRARPSLAQAVSKPRKKAARAQGVERSS